MPADADPRVARPGFSTEIAAILTAFIIVQAAILAFIVVRLLVD